MTARLVNPNAKQLAWPLVQSDGRPSLDVQEWLRKLDEEVDLFMVTEAFNDSLVLLGRCLGLQPEDITSPIADDVRHSGGHTLQLTEQDRAAIRKLSSIDAALHDHARERFQELRSLTVSSSGEHAWYNGPNVSPEDVDRAAASWSRSSKNSYQQAELISYQ